MQKLLNKIHLGDCLELMRQMPDKCVDLVLTDPPYGTTNLEWDKIENLLPIFYEINRVSKNMVMTSSLKLAIMIIPHFQKWFKYEIIWDKVMVSNVANAKIQPLRSHELILVFGGDYYPVKTGLSSKPFGKKHQLLRSILLEI